MSLFSLVCRAHRRPWGLTRFRSCPPSLRTGSIIDGVRPITSQAAPIGGDSSIANVRNIGIVAHIDAGKTTTTEQMLFNSGASRHAGNVDYGDTVTDFLPMERQRGITIQSAAITFQWPNREYLKAGDRQCIINLIDTPGHVDFRFEVERCMPVLDGAVCVIDGVEGVETHTERVWASAQEFKIPRIIFVNKLDRDGASFKKSVQDIGLKLNGIPLVCQIPWWGKDKVKGIADVITGTVVSWSGTRDLPDELSKHAPEGTLKDELAVAREKLIEQLAEKDDAILEQWTTLGKDIPDADIRKSIRRVIQDGEGTLIPVFAGASLKNIGVIPLLGAVNDYLPSPGDRPELEVRVGQTQKPLGQILEKASDTKKSQGRIEALASVFKVVNDPRRGMLTFVRVYHGLLKKNTPMWNANLQEFERPLQMMQISAGTTIEIPHLSPGQIGAITGLKGARTGDTLLTFGANKAPQTELASIQVRPPTIPPAVAFIVLEAHSPSGVKPLEAALQNLSREDPSLRWSRDEKTEQYTISGMGTLHLEVARDRLENHYKVEALWGNIAVDYKECLLSPTSQHRAIYEKVVAGKAGKAACSVTLEPVEQHHIDNPTPAQLERDGNLIQVDIAGNSPSFDAEDTRRQLINGAIAALARGPRRSSPMHRCLVKIEFSTTTDLFGAATPASHFVGAANKAVRTALKEAHTKDAIGIMEPVMKATIVCPESAAGTVQHDLHSARGGRVLEVKDNQDASTKEGADVDISDIYAPPDPYEFQTTLREARQGRLRTLEIVCQVPLAEILDYDSVLRSKTAGRHTLTMALDTFERVTGPREKALV